MVEDEETVVTVSLSAIREVLAHELAIIFSQFGHDQGPREYEVDYIVGGIAQRGTPAHLGRPGGRERNL